MIYKYADICLLFKFQVYFGARNVLLIPKVERDLINHSEMM